MTEFLMALRAWRRVSRRQAAGVAQVRHLGNRLRTIVVTCTRAERQFLLDDEPEYRFVQVRCHVERENFLESPRSRRPDPRALWR